MGKRSKHKNLVNYFPSFQALAEATKSTANTNSNNNPAEENAADKNEIDLGLRSAADYPRQPIEWLWPEKIPLGKVTLLIGDPGLGKTLVALDLASRVTRGAPFPAPFASPFASSATTNHTEHAPNAPNSFSGTPLSTLDARLAGSVLILTAEDEIADTIRPRLDAHGADPAKVFFASELTDLRRDREKLAAILDRLPDCRLIIVDPVNAFVGPSDSHFHTIVRKVLARLAELAAKRKVAILAVTHLRKNTGAAIHRAAGSMGFVAAARTVWTICRDPADPGRNLLLPVKNNVAQLSPGLAYSIEPHSELDAPVVRWQPLPVTTSAEDVLKPRVNQRGPEAEDRRQAGDWLKIALAAGPRDSWYVLQEGVERGFSHRTLRRALHAIGGITRKEAFDAGWMWSLPDLSHQDPPHESPHPPDAKQPGRFDETWPLRENPDKNATPRSSTPNHSPPSLPEPPRDVERWSHRPTLEQSMKFLDCLESKLRHHDPPPNPSSPTNNPLLDKILTEFRLTSPSANSQLSTLHSEVSQLSTLNSQPASAHKKSARSHSRFNTGTDSRHSRPADPCESGAMHLSDVSAHVQDKSNTRRRGDAI